MVSREKYVFLFEEGRKENKLLLGGKGANLAEMALVGLPIPPGFTLSTKACNYYLANKHKHPKTLKEEVHKALRVVEEKTGKKFGGTENPLLVSVRSGAPVSMPGMMDTILNLGLNEKTMTGLIKQSGNRRFALDSYRRLIQMFGNVVTGIESAEFEEVLKAKKKKFKAKSDIELDERAFEEIISEFKKIYSKHNKKSFPSDPADQLFMAIDAVFGSWNNKRAITYRKINHIGDSIGTAVNIQTMVFGNLGTDSGTGVGFTRNPSTGENKLYGEYLINAQGEDVVSGSRTPKPISEMSKDFPSIYSEISSTAKKLELHYADMQDFEFTIERGKLWMLQTRTGKRTAEAAVRIAVDMQKEGILSKKEAILRIEPAHLDKLLHKRIDPKKKPEAIAKGLPASPGAAFGTVIFTADEAEKLAEKGKKVMLVRPETTPEDIHGVVAAQGVLTSHGGMTCVSGETTILTNKGFCASEKLFSEMENGKKFKILSFDSKKMKTVWRKIIAAGRRVSETEEFDVSQTNRTQKNTLRITPDHKMITFNNGNLEKKEIGQVFEDNELLCLVDKIPDIENRNEPALAYAAGALLTDGYINLKETKGSVTFIQKDTEEKKPFFKKIKKSFKKALNHEFSYERARTTSSEINGRKICGSVVDLICFKREPAKILSNIKENTAEWALGLDEESTLEFLAGVIDGDGSFSNNRIQIYAGNEELAQGIVVAGLKLGIVPQISINRNIYNIQIVERMKDILSRSARITMEPTEKKYGSKLFSVRQILSQETNRISNHGRTKEMVKRNLLMDANKLKRDYLPFCKRETKAILRKILESELRMYRLKKQSNKKTEAVYNFEVDAKIEIDKNFVAFSSRYSPILVSNSHAAVVARGMGKPCVAGCEEILINLQREEFRVGSRTIKKGDHITIDGMTGEVMLGTAELIDPEMSKSMRTLLKWADKIRVLGVRANADNPHDSMIARKFGAEGIGLCRTEHMFMQQERLPVVRQMIMASDQKERKKVLAKLLPMQRTDFVGIFKAMSGLPVVIRLLDPPLHEFLPDRLELAKKIKELECTQPKSKKLGDLKTVYSKVSELSEKNPMLGFRGCRLGILYPEIYEMQARAIFEAASIVKSKGFKVMPRVMIPLIGFDEELKLMRDLVEGTAREVISKKGISLQYKIGTMLELPRACLIAGEIAKHAEFFSFGTNDLTQTTLGISRDDAEAMFLGHYVDEGVIPRNPFAVLDSKGVGRLIKIAFTEGRKANKSIGIGICGEHGGDPESIDFCNSVGLDYVSCSPFRVPIARLAAAQAVLRAEIKNS